MHQIDAGGAPEVYTPVPLPLTAISQVAVGGDSVAARAADGTVRWSKSEWSTAVPGVASTIDIGVGANHMCARISGGSVKCWGNSDYGQLGNGGTSAFEPPSLATATGLTATGPLVLGPADSFVLTASGFFGWGLNDFGQIGSGAPSNRLTPVAAFAGAAQVSAGPDFTCVVTTTGAVQCVGKNDLGQLGDNTLSDRTGLVAVAGLGTATQVSCGTGFACALLTGKTVACWGRNDVGELGNMSTVSSKVPVAVKGLSGVVSIAASDSSACALLADKVTVKCWGNAPRVGAGSAPGDTTVPVTVVW
jgi:alpha-tubulin suppressor-like RCC1 family protein